MVDSVTREIQDCRGVIPHARLGLDNMEASLLLLDNINTHDAVDADYYERVYFIDEMLRPTPRLATMIDLTGSSRSRAPSRISLFKDLDFDDDVKCYNPVDWGHGGPFGAGSEPGMDSSARSGARLARPTRACTRGVPLVNAVSLVSVVRGRESTINAP